MGRRCIQDVPWDADHIREVTAIIGPGERGHEIVTVVDGLRDSMGSGGTIAGAWECCAILHACLGAHLFVPDALGLDAHRLKVVVATIDKAAA